MEIASIKAEMGEVNAELLQLRELKQKFFRTLHGLDDSKQDGRASVNDKDASDDIILDVANAAVNASRTGVVLDNISADASKIVAMYVMISCVMSS